MYENIYNYTLISGVFLYQERKLVLKQNKNKTREIQVKLKTKHKSKNQSTESQQTTAKDIHNA